jgi:Spy/CpxP family protein refolding chaperone
MRNWLMGLVVAGLVMGTASAWAGGSCCPSKKSKSDDAAKSGAWGACDSALSSLELTADQKAKIFDIQQSCKKDGCSKEACKKSMGEIRDVLTPEQQAKWDESMKSCGDGEKSDADKKSDS